MIVCNIYPVNFLPGLDTADVDAAPQGSIGPAPEPCVGAPRAAPTRPSRRDGRSVHRNDRRRRRPAPAEHRGVDSDLVPVPLVTVPLLTRNRRFHARGTKKRVLVGCRGHRDRKYPEGASIRGHRPVFGQSMAPMSSPEKIDQIPQICPESRARHRDRRAEESGMRAAASGRPICLVSGNVPLPERCL